MKLFVVALWLCAAAGQCLAQRDFLTADEIEKIREAQIPNDRLKLYVLFARQRIDQLTRLLEKEKKGRSLTARELLEDYSRILDAIDTVSDDALKRHVDIAEGAAAVSAAEDRFLKVLRKIEDQPPSDLGLYSVALKEALSSTTDSMEQAKADLGKRTEQLSAESDKVREETKSIMAAEAAKGKPEQQSASVAAEDGKPKRKPPTLYKPGEKPEPPK